MPAPTLLVPIDFSDCSASLVEQASALAQELGASMVLMHAVELPSGVDPHSLVQPHGTQSALSARQYLRDNAQARLEPFVRLCADLGIATTSRLGEGVAADAILDVARSLQPTMIVMGTRGRTGVARALLGSTSEAVSRGAQVPVTTIHTQYQPSCAARSCQWCATAVTAEHQQLAAEVDG